MLGFNFFFHDKTMAGIVFFFLSGAACFENHIKSSMWGLIKDALKLMSNFDMFK